MTVLARNNVHARGTGDKAMLFAHGFGCDQNMWRFVAPAFESEFRTVYSIMLARVAPIFRLMILSNIPR
jgi:pimeloyl-ACP methyl ester carboxylesterase